MLLEKHRLCSPVMGDNNKTSSAEEHGLPTGNCISVSEDDLANRMANVGMNGSTGSNVTGSRLLTMEDLGSIFEPDVDQDFFQDFMDTSTRCGGMRSVPMQVEFYIPKYTLDDVESGRVTLGMGMGGDLYEIITQTISIPVGFANFARATIDGKLSIWATNNASRKIWKSIVSRRAAAGLEPLICTSCGCRPAERKLAEILKGVPEGRGAFLVHHFPCFPICDNDKCELVAKRVLNRLWTKAMKADTGIPRDSIGPCNFCSKMLGKDRLLTCSRCKAASYCSLECREKDWARHKKACKLINCSHCGRLETSVQDPFSSCSRCLSTYYCGKECQRSDWKSHKVSCKKTSSS